jgi:four helix bundle protein
MAGVRRVQDLLVWKLCDQVRRRVRTLVVRPAWRAHGTLRRQLEDAAEAACPNVREGFDRYHPRDFARFLRIAKATLGETIEHLDPARARGLTTTEEAEEITALCDRGRAAAIRLIRYLESATAPNVRRPRPKPRRPSRPPGSRADDTESPEPGPQLWEKMKTADRGSRRTDRPTSEERVANEDPRTRT